MFDATYCQVVKFGFGFGFEFDHRARQVSTPVAWDSDPGSWSTSLLGCLVADSVPVNNSLKFYHGGTEVTERHRGFAWHSCCR